MKHSTIFKWDSKLYFELELDFVRTISGSAEPAEPLPPKVTPCRTDASKLLQVVESQHGYSSRPALTKGPSSKVMGRGMMGKGMKDMTLVLFPCQTFPCPFFSLVSGRSQILHFVALQVKLDASALLRLARGEASILLSAPWSRMSFCAKCFKRSAPKRPPPRWVFLFP